VVGPPPPSPPDCSNLAAPPAPQPVPEVELTFSEAQVLELNSALIRHCIQLQDRVAVLDPPAPGMNPDEIIDWRTSFSSSYGALYFPWLLTVDDHGNLKQLPPSGAVAGVLARVSLRDSVAKPPANELLYGVAGAVARIDELTHSRLNDFSVNAIRTVAGRGLRVLGARTCLAAPGLTLGRANPAATPDPSGLGFLNVRRVVSMVEAVVVARLRPVVFDANLQRTWNAIERSVRIFLDDLWRAGGLDGSTASDAYLVRCDRTTNPQVDVDEGRLTCVVGIRPPWPAEFVFVRVSATAAGADIQESSSDG
jgi:phage tail sheath protein FI